MNNRFLIALTTLLLFASCQQGKVRSDDNLVSIQIIDRNGLSETISVDEKLDTYQKIDFLNPQPYNQVLRIFHKNEEGKHKSVLTQYHPNGHIASLIEGRDNRANGKYREWHSNGKLKLEAHVMEGPLDLNPTLKREWIFDGVSKVWDEEEVLIAEINYSKGSLEGDSKYYYHSGSLSKIIPYEKNEIHGEMCEYRENGKLMKKAFYEKGMKSGPSLSFKEDETPILIEHYEKDKLITAVYFNKKNEVLGEVQGGFGTRADLAEDGSYTLFEIQKGEVEGKVMHYTSEGELLKEYFLKNGKKQGEESEYYLKNEKTLSKPMLKLLLHWDDNCIHGTVKTWYNDGKLESQKEMHKNRKNGISCGWYNEGSLMFIEEYENDKLLKGTYFRFKETEPVSKILNGEGTAYLFDGKTGQFLKKMNYAAGFPQE